MRIKEYLCDELKNFRERHSYEPEYLLISSWHLINLKKECSSSYFIDLSKVDKFMGLKIIEVTNDDVIRVI